MLGVALVVSLIAAVVAGSPWLLVAWLVCSAALAPVFVRPKVFGTASPTRTRAERIVLVLLVAAVVAMEFTRA